MSELFLNVLNTSIMAGWVVLAVLLLRLLLKKAPAWIRCTLWGIVGLRLVWPFKLKSAISLIPSTQILHPEELYDYTPELDTGISVLDDVINPGFTQVFESEIANSVNPLQVAVAIAGYLWLAGMGAMTLYVLVSYLRLRLRVRVSMPVGEGVYLCDQVKTPFILGVIRPKIYFPSALPEEKWKDILAHERAHLARRDHWWKPLGFILLAVYWFHPLLWVAYGLLCRDMESAADERVVREMSTEEKRDYSQTLLECSVSNGRIAACPLAFGEVGVKQRIKAVLHYKKPALWIIIAAVLICIAAGVCFLTEKGSNRYNFDDSQSDYIWVAVERIENGFFYGRSAGGAKVSVDSEIDESYVGKCLLINWGGELPIDSDGESLCLCITKVDYWTAIEAEQFALHTSGVCELDIDGDGVVEQCSLEWGETFGSATSYLVIRENGEEQDTAVIYTPRTLVLRVQDSRLSILVPEANDKDTYDIKEYSVEYVDSVLYINGEPATLLSENMIPYYACD